MPGWLIEIIMVWNYRERSLWMLIIGMIGCSLILMWADHINTEFHLSGSMAMVEDSIKAKLVKYADREALGVLITSIIAAVKMFIKDKKQMDRHF